MVTGQEILTVLATAKNALDLLRGARELVPVGDQRDRLQEEIDKLEVVLQEAQASHAKALGFNLCQCTYPPSPMLWRESERFFVCPRVECGHRIENPNPIAGVFVSEPRGPNSWMGR